VLPCFFLLGADSFAYSARVPGSARRITDGGRSPKLLAHGLACLVIVAVWTSLQFFFLPRIISALI
jgi:hypothetical protein